MRSSALLVAILAAGCVPAPPEDARAGAAVLDALGDEAAAWKAAEEEAQAAFAAGDWGGAAARLEAKVSLYPGTMSARLREPRRRDLYNLACARALGGRTAEAMDALEQAVGDGFGEIGFDHLAGDPDLESLHGEPRWKALLRRLSWNGEVAVTCAAGDAAPRLPLVVKVRVGRSCLDHDPPLEGAVVAVPVPPYSLGPFLFEWTTRIDPGERAAEKAALAVEVGTKAFPVIQGRTILFASGKEAVRVAWEVLLRRPDLFTAAILDGPTPPPWVLLDRGVERVKARLLATGPDGVPDPRVPVKVAVAGPLPGGLFEALR